MKGLGYDKYGVNYLTLKSILSSPWNEGLWAIIKQWLLQSGAYNLNEMLDLFQWFYLQKIEGRNPFWRLLELIAESNDYENVNNAQVDEVPDVEGAAVGGDDVETIKVWSNFHFSFSIILCLVQKK